MLLDRVFQPFLEQRPICVMARAALERLLDPARLDALFERTAQHQYTQTLLIAALGATLPSWLPGYHVKILDGNHLEATEHRLHELRTTWAAPLPGKGLVVLDQPTLTVTDVLLAEDGQAQERSLLPDVLPLV